MDMPEFIEYTVEVISQAAYTTLDWNDVRNGTAEEKIKRFIEATKYSGKPYRASLYAFLNGDDEIIYVGKSQRLPDTSRFQEHLGRGAYKKQATPVGEYLLSQNYERFKIRVYDLPCVFESFLIWYLKPPLNATDAPL